MLFGFAHGAGEGVRGVDGVGVGEEEPFGGVMLDGVLGSGPAGVGFAVESGVGAGEVDLGGFEDGEAGVGLGEVLGDGEGLIGGGVIYQDEVPVFAEVEA